MQRAALRATVGTTPAQADVPIGVFSAAAPMMVYNATTNVFEGSAQGIPGAFAAGDVPQWNGTLWAPKFRGYGFNAAAQVLAVTALADMAGHTFTLPRAGTYQFKLRGAYQSNATTTGLRISANYSGTTTTYNGAMEVTTGAAGAVEYFAQTALNTAMGSGTGPGAVNVGFEFWGRITVSTGGTFAFQIASEVAVAAGITLAIGADSELYQV